MLEAIAFVLGAQVTPQSPADALQYYADHGYYGFGETVGRASDVNHDGVPDYIIGDSGIPGVLAPRLWVVSGKDSATLLSLELPSAGPLCSLLDGGGDADGDGAPDLLLCSFGFGARNRLQLVLLGKEGGRLGSLADGDSAALDPCGARFAVNADPARAARVMLLGRDRDKSSGLLREISGASGQCTSRRVLRTNSNSAWRAFVLRRRSRDPYAPELVLVTDTSVELHALEAAPARDRSTVVWRIDRTPCAGPAALLEFGDQDGDGFEDLAFNSGEAVEIVSGATGRVIRALESKVHRDSETGFGRALAALGDIDGDGVEDLAVSETEAGAFQGIVHAFSGGTGRELWKTNTLHDEALYHFGMQMAALGDVDHDGATDLIVATSAVLAKEPGCACLISGKSGVELRRIRRRNGTDLEVTPRLGSGSSPR